MTDIRRAQTWECNEARADAEDVPPAHDTVGLWPDHPRFSAVVDRVQGDVAELVVATSNSHPRAPDLGDCVDVHVEKLLEQDRWSLKSDAADVEDSAADPPLVTDGGQCAGTTDHEFDVGDCFIELDNFKYKITNRMLDVDTGDVLYRLAGFGESAGNVSKVLTESKLKSGFDRYVEPGTDDSAGGSDDE